jgi:hypothetical protein
MVIAEALMVGYPESLGMEEAFGSLFYKLRRMDASMNAQDWMRPIFLGASLPTDERRAVERDLIAKYHRRLVNSGVAGFDFDAAWSAYRQGAMYGVFLFVGMGAQVEDSDRAVAVITDQIRRYADMAIDLEAPQAAGLA